MDFWMASSPFDDYQRPSQITDQLFGLALEPEDMMMPRDVRNLFRYPARYMRPWRPQVSQRDVGSIVSMAKDHFRVNLDVQQFKPEEISVKVTGDNTVTIEGKHDEKQDEHGYVSRHFVRKYMLPKGHDVSKIESKLSSDGVLTITAPKMPGPGEEESRNVPIMHTGEAYKAVEQKKDEKKKDEQKKDEKKKDEQKKDENERIYLPAKA